MLGSLGTIPSRPRRLRVRGLFAACTLSQHIRSPWAQVGLGTVAAATERMKVEITKARILMLFDRRASRLGA